MKKTFLLLFAALLLTACTGYNNSTSVSENNISYDLSSDRSEAMAHAYYWNAKEDSVVITIPDTLSDGTPVKKVGGFTGIGVPASFAVKYNVIFPELPKSSKQMSEEEINAFYKDYADNHPDELYGHMMKLSSADGSGDTSGAGSGEGGEVPGADTGKSGESTDPVEIVYKDVTFTINIGKNVSSMGRNMTTYSICYDINNYGIVQTDGTVLVYRPSLYFNVDPDNKTYYSKDGVIYTSADDTPVTDNFDNAE